MVDTSRKGDLKRRPLKFVQEGTSYKEETKSLYFYYTIILLAIIIILLLFICIKGLI